MRTTHPKLTVAITAIALSIPAWLAATQAVASRWTDQEINIDGAVSEWPVLTALDENISVAAANDGKNLYLAIATSDAQRRRQLAITGLMVWLDPAGGKKEKYGIRIPGADFQMPGGRFGGARNGDSSQPPEPPQPKITYVELLGPGKDDRRRLDLAAESAIAVAAAVNEGTLLYEFRLPLAESSTTQPYGIGAKTDKPLGFGLQIPTPEFPQGGGQRGGGGLGGGGRSGGGRGGIGGTGRGGGGFGGGGMRGRGGAQMKELKVWTTLTLAREAR